MADATTYKTDAEIDAERLQEMTRLTQPASATARWEDVVENPDVDAVLVSSTPEHLHHPMAKACLEAGKHVLLEKPIALTLDEADDLIATAERVQSEAEADLLSMREGMPSEEL